MYDVTPLHVHLIYSRAHDLLADLQLDLVPARQRLLHGYIELRLALPPEILHFPAFDVERANGQDKPGIFKYLRLEGGGGGKLWKVRSRLYRSRCLQKIVRNIKY